MAAPVISRLVLTDDDGTGLTGTPLNNALFQDLQNRIDTLSAAIVAQFPVLPAGVVTSANLAGMLRDSAAVRTLSVVSVPAVTVDRSAYEVVVIAGLNQSLTINAPTWSYAGNVAPFDEASLVFRIWDAGASVPLVWNAVFYPLFGIPLPTATPGGGGGPIMHIAFRYSAPHNCWFCVALARA
jgi:hypothetical protein